MRKKFMKRTAGLVLSVVLFVSTTIIPVPQVVKAEEKAEDKSAWTIALYMCGSDLESRQASASNDLLEILQAKDMPDNVQIIIETGGSKKWFLKDTVANYYQQELGLSETEIDRVIPEEISSDYIQRYKINFRHEYTTDEQKVETCPALELIEDKVAINNPEVAKEGEKAVNMGEKDTLQKFLEYVRKQYPANHMAIDLWNHGSGPVGGVCSDSYASGDMLDLNELQSALSGLQMAPGEKFDMIGFDACLMSSYEVWTLLSPYAEYGVGSMTTEPGDGWYYKTFLEDLGANSTNADYTGADLSKAVVNSYREYYKEDGIYVTDKCAGQSEVAADQVGSAMLSCYDLKKVVGTNAAFDNLADTLLYLSEDTDGMKEMLRQAQDTSVVEKGFEVVGLSSFLKETVEYARTRSEELKASQKVYDQNFAQKYELYITQAESLAESLFTGKEAAVLNTYDGWKGSEHEKQSPMSVYFPLTSSGQYGFVNYTTEKYPLLGISSQYARLVYKIAAGIEKKQYEEIETSLAWDAEKESYQYTLNKEQAPYINSIGVQKYKKVDNEYYLVEMDESKDPALYEVKPDNSYIKINGVPVASEVYWENKEEGYTIYSTKCLVNDEEVTMYYVDDGKDVGLYYYDYDEMIAGDEQYSMKPGDTITPMVVAADQVEYYNGYERETRTKMIKEAAYKVKESDIIKMEDSEYTLLPIKKEKMNMSDLNYAFFTFTNAIDTDHIKSYSSIVNHQDVLDFSKADVTLEKTKYEVTGDPIKPAVTVKNASKIYEEGKDYKLFYENNIGKGTATVTISGLGQYSALPKVKKEFSIVAASAKTDVKEVEKQVTIPTEVVKEVEKQVTKIVTLPKSVKMTSVKKKNGKIIVKYKKKNIPVNYQIAYTQKKSGKKKIIGSTDKNSYTIRSSKKKKVRYVYVRAYRTIDGEKYYGTWSKRMKVK